MLDMTLPETLSLVEKINVQLHLKQECSPSAPLCVAIDGKAGAGKTSFANLLSKNQDYEIVHMDDFFLPPSLRTPKRLAEPGGNIHYERFLEEIMEPLLAEKVFGQNRQLHSIRYRRFSCSTMDYTDSLKLERKPILLFEGSYSHHPKFHALYDFRIFLDISPQVQKERILSRNGVQAYENFRTRWIPMEEQYFRTFQIKENSDFIL